MERRSYLRAAGVALVGLVPGCGGTADRETTASLTPADVPEPDATVDVGPGGDAVFSPGTAEPLAVGRGATVQFVWQSDGHNVVVPSRPERAEWSGTAGAPEKRYDRGHVHEHTFETPGVYRYYCQEHRGVGMEGTLLVGRDFETWTPSPTPLPEDLPQPDADAVVVVGPDGTLVFDPADQFVNRGATVAFVWASDGHNVVVDRSPADATWSGTAGPTDETYDRGHVHEHTFEVAGAHEYHCEPHEAAGMRGRIVVE